MKRSLLLSVFAVGVLSLTFLPQARADDDLGAAILGFALGATVGGSATMVYGAPPPVVYAPPPAVVYGPPAVVYTRPPRVYYYGDHDRGRWHRRPHWRHHGWRHSRWHSDDDD